MIFYLSIWSAASLDEGTNGHWKKGLLFSCCDPQWKVPLFTFRGMAPGVHVDDPGVSIDIDEVSLCVSAFQKSSSDSAPFLRVLVTFSVFYCTPVILPIVFHSQSVKKDTHARPLESQIAACGEWRLSWIADTCLYKRSVFGTASFPKASQGCMVWPRGKQYSCAA